MMLSFRIVIPFLAALLVGCDSDPMSNPSSLSGSGSRGIETNISFSVLDGSKGYQTNGALHCASSGLSDLTRAWLFIEGRPGAAVDTFLTGKNWLYQFNMSVHAPTRFTFTCWSDPTLSQTQEVQLTVDGSELGSPLPTVVYRYAFAESDHVTAAPTILLSFEGGPAGSLVVPRRVGGIGTLRADDIPGYTERIAAKVDNDDAYFHRKFRLSWTNAQRETINQLFFPKDVCLANLPPGQRNLQTCIQATNELLFWSEVEYTDLVGYRKRYVKEDVLLITRFLDSGLPIDSEWISLVHDVVADLNTQGMDLTVNEHERVAASGLFRESWGMYHTRTGDGILVLPVDGQSEDWLATHYEFHPPFYRINASSFQIGSPTLNNREQAHVDLLKVILGANESPTLASFPAEYQILFLQNWITLLRKHDFGPFPIVRGDQVDNVLAVE